MAMMRILLNFADSPPKQAYFLQGFFSEKSSHAMNRHVTMWLSEKLLMCTLYSTPLCPPIPALLLTTLTTHKVVKARW